MGASCDCDRECVHVFESGDGVSATEPYVKYRRYSSYFVSHWENLP